MNIDANLKRTIIACMVFISYGIPAAIADDAWRVQFLMSSSILLDEAQHINIETGAGKAIGASADKTASGFILEWAPKIIKTQTRTALGNTISLEHYNLRETDDFCVLSNRGNCPPQSVNLNNWHLGYRYHFPGGFFLGLNLGLLGKMKQTQVVQTLRGTERIRIESSGTSPYAVTLGYSYRNPRSGFTFGFHYLYAAAGDYDFDRLCVELLEKEASECTNQPFDANDRSTKVSYDVIGVTLGWTWL